MAARTEFEFKRDMSLYAINSLVKEIVIKNRLLHQYLKQRRILGLTIRAISMSVYAFVIPQKGNFILQPSIGRAANPLRLFDPEYVYMHMEHNWQEVINGFYMFEYETSKAQNKYQVTMLSLNRKVRKDI